MICDAVFARTPDTRVLQLNEGWRDIRSLTGPQEQVSAARPQTLIRKITELALGLRMPGRVHRIFEAIPDLPLPRPRLVPASIVPVPGNHSCTLLAS